jgi:hypothetical protein
MSQDWEQHLADGIAALERAHVALDDITGWSGGSGNWPAQEAHPKVRAALAIIRATEPPTSPAIPRRMTPSPFAAVREILDAATLCECGHSLSLHQGHTHAVGSPEPTHCSQVDGCKRFVAWTDRP